MASKTGFDTGVVAASDWLNMSSYRGNKFVMGGVARRSWARNPHAMETSEEFNRTHADGYHITMPYVADEKLVQKVVKE